LRYGDEVRSADDYFPKTAKAEAKLTRLVTELIDARTEGWSERFLEDTVQEQMKKIVAGKKPRRGKADEPEATATTGGNVVSIMDALKRSVAGEKGKGKSTT
jgi:DNA end-binding protein Ku